jgi:hypothetical protein
MQSADAKALEALKSKNIRQILAESNAISTASKERSMEASEVGKEIKLFEEQ